MKDSPLGSSLSVQIDQPIKQDVGFGELLKKEFTTFNTAAQLYNQARDDLYSVNDIDPEFDPFTQPEFENYKQYADSFTDVYNRKAFERKIKKLDSELEYYKMNENASVWESAGAALLSGIADPLNWIGIGEAKGVYSLATRESMKQAAKRTALLAGGTQAANEVTSQMTMETRTAADSGVSIAAATLLGGVLGGASAYLRRPLKETSDLMEKELDTMEALRSVGAAQVSKEVATTLEQETLKSAFGLEKAFGAKGVPVLSDVVRSPTLALLNSPSLASRRIAQQLAEIPNYLKKFEEGIAAPEAVESIIRQHNVRVLDSMRDVEGLFKQYRQAGTAKIFAEDVSGFVTKSDNRKMTMMQFREEIGNALINDDKHPIPEVQKAAQVIRQKIFEPLKNEAIDVGLLPDDIDALQAESYFSRVWNQDLITAERPQFEQIAYDYIADAQRNVNSYAENVSANLDKARTLKSKLEAEIQDIQESGRDISPALSKDREKLKRREYRLGVEMARLKDAEKTFNDFLKMSESKRVAEVDARVKSLIDTWKSSANVKYPKSFSQFVRSIGGVSADDIDLTPKMREGKNIVRKEGMTLDDIGERGFEEGYFSERPTVAEVINMLEDDIQGRKSYSIIDAEEVANIDAKLENIAEVDQMFTEMGITRDMTNEQIAQRIAESEGKKLKLADSKGKALKAQAGFYERYARKRLEQIDQRVVKLKNESDELAASVSVASEKMKAGKSIIDNKKYELSKVNERISRMNRMLDENRIFSSMGEAELRDIATEVTENILGMSLANTHLKMPALRRGSLKERTFHIPNKMVSRYIEKDAFSVAKRYVHTVAPDIEMTRKFGRADLRDQIQEISGDYVKLLNDAKARGASEKEIQKITQNQKMDLEHIEGIRDRLNGTYARPSTAWGMRGRRVARGILGYNVATSLGGVVISSMVDAFSAVTSHGIGRMFKGTMRNFAKRIKKAPRPEKREAEIAGVVGEAYINTRAHSISDVLDPYNTGNKFERAINYAADKSVAITGFNIFVDGMREIIAGVSIDRSMNVIKKIAAGQNVSQKEITRLAMFGLDANDAKRIWQQFQKHGTMDGGEFVVNSHLWDDVALSRKWTSALGKEILKANIQPGQEKPLFMSTGLGSVMFQFKSFVAAANQRILIAGLQARDAETLQGIIGMIGMGMLVAYIRMEPDQMPDDFNGWLREGIDRSGVFGWAMEANNVVEKLSGNNVGLSALMGTRPPSRYSSRGAMGAIFGPTFGKADDMLKVMHAIGTGELSEADSKSIRRLMFLQNNWYLKGMFDEVEKGLNEALVY